MSKNNTIRKSDKKFIRTEKSRIRRQFSDSKKQEEMINKLYEKFAGTPKAEVVKETPAPKVEAKKVEVKKEEVKPASAKSSGVAKKDKKVKAK